MTVLLVSLVIGVPLVFSCYQWCSYVCGLSNDFRIDGNKGVRKGKLEKFLDGLEVIENM